MRCRSLRAAHLDEVVGGAYFARISSLEEFVGEGARGGAECVVGVMFTSLGKPQRNVVPLFCVVKYVCRAGGLEGWNPHGLWMTTSLLPFMDS